MKKVLPVFAKINPRAMAGWSDAVCECCGEKKEVWAYLYHSAYCCSKKDVFHDLCLECAKLCGSGERWKYVGGGEIQTISGTICPISRITK